MEDPLNDDECPICLEPFDPKKPFVTMNCCSGQKIHTECYIKSMVKCPFCRYACPDTKSTLPIIVTITDWPRITRTMCTTMFATACLCTVVALVASETCPKS